MVSLGGDPDLALAVSDDYASAVLALILSLGSCLVGTALFFLVFVPLWASIVEPPEPPKPSSLQNSIQDMKRARIRSVVVSAGITPEQQKEKHRQMASLAAYNVATAVKEAFPRIHALVVEWGGQSSLAHPHAADVDPVAELVYQELHAMHTVTDTARTDLKQISNTASDIGNKTGSGGSGSSEDGRSSSRAGLVETGSSSSSGINNGTEQHSTAAPPPAAPAHLSNSEAHSLEHRVLRQIAEKEAMAQAMKLVEGEQACW